MKYFKYGIIIGLMLLLCNLKPCSQEPSGNMTVELDGEGDYGQVPDSPSLFIRDAITLESWIYINPGSKAPQFFLAKEGLSGIEKEISYSFQFTGSDINFYFTRAEGSYSISTTYNLLGEWHHIAGVFNPSDTSISISIDGILQNIQYFPKLANHSVNPGIAEQAGPLYIGAGPDRNNDSKVDATMSGKLDDMRIWNYARTQQDIQHYMNSPLTGNEAGLAAYWKFDQASRGVTPDATPNHNDVSLVGDAGLAPSTAPVGDLTFGGNYLASFYIKEQNQGTYRFYIEDIPGDPNVVNLRLEYTYLEQPIVETGRAKVLGGTFQGTLMSTTPVERGYYVSTFLDAQRMSFDPSTLQAIYIEGAFERKYIASGLSVASPAIGSGLFQAERIEPK
jgi:hypothetical protein